MSKASEQIRCRSSSVFISSTFHLPQTHNQEQQHIHQDVNASPNASRDYLWVFSHLVQSKICNVDLECELAELWRERSEEREIGTNSQRVILKDERWIKTCQKFENHWLRLAFQLTHLSRDVRREKFRSPNGQGTKHCQLIVVRISLIVESEERIQI